MYGLSVALMSHYFLGANRLYGIIFIDGFFIVYNRLIDIIYTYIFEIFYVNYRDYMIYVLIKVSKKIYKNSSRHII